MLACVPTAETKLNIDKFISFIDAKCQFIFLIMLLLLAVCSHSSSCNTEKTKQLYECFDTNLPFLLFSFNLR